LLALILPLGLDTFAISAALGLAGISRSDRMRIAVLFTAFEALMPVAGLLLGFGLGRAVGGYAELLAAVVLIAVGVWMLVSPDGDDATASLVARARGWAAMGLGLSISIDELAIGFTLGLVGVPVPPAIVLIAVQAFIASQLGFRLGARAGARVSEGAERVAGVALVLLGLALGTLRLLGAQPPG